MKHKYKLNDMLSKLPRAKAIKAVIQDMEKEGISERAFFRDRAILVNDGADIPSNRLMIYAKYFNVAIEQLYNYDTNVKPVMERIPSAAMKKVMKRTGLKK